MKASPCSPFPCHRWHTPHSSLLQFSWPTGMVCLLINYFPVFTQQIVGLPLFILSLLSCGFKWVPPAPALVLDCFKSPPDLSQFFTISQNYQLLILLKSLGKNSKQFLVITAVSTTILCQHSSRPQESLVAPAFPALRRLSWGKAAPVSQQWHAFICRGEI